MMLHLGDLITAADCHGKQVTGIIINFLDHTVIIEANHVSYVIRKTTLSDQGYAFPNYKKIKTYPTRAEKETYLTKKDEEK